MTLTFFGEVSYIAGNNGEIVLLSEEKNQHYYGNSKV